MSKFFTIEGPNGAGKTTIIRALSKIFYENEDRLKSAGYCVEDLIITKEPFGIYRQFFEERKEFTCPVEKFLFMMASRALHFKEIIRPNIYDNKIIICDRFYESSLVHHVLIDNLNENFVKDIHLKITGYYQPERVFFIDSINIEKNLRSKGEDVDIDKINDERCFFRRLFKTSREKASFFSNDTTDGNVSHITKAIFETILTDLTTITRYSDDRF